MAPSAAELARFGALLDAGEVPIGGYAEQDFLNAVYKARPLMKPVGRATCACLQADCSMTGEGSRLRVTQQTVPSRAACCVVAAEAAEALARKA